MNLAMLSDYHQKWQDILVIGRTIEQDGQKYHILGMTLSGNNAKFYIIEPYNQQKSIKIKGIHNHRRMLKEHGQINCRYLGCSEFCLGTEKLRFTGGQSDFLEYDTKNYGTIQLFLDMMSSGWTVPEWLQNRNWANLQLVTLNIDGNMDKLPDYSPNIPITITHSPDFTPHLLEKTVTLTVGKSRSFSFIDAYGEDVQCHINKVSLVDMWQEAEKQLSDPQLTAKLSPEQLAEVKKQLNEALAECCPKGMYYIGIEYECSKNYDLQFYTKQYLKFRPETSQGSVHFITMRLKPNQATGTHGLALKGCGIETPVPSDTTKIPAELFLYNERIDAWTETV